MKYQPHIDGLRAFAVLSVVLFHAGFEELSGGFLGVDVFFVISGYLITTLLLEDLENQHFSFVKFYIRRARRILPVLLFVLAITSVFTWYYLLPSDLVDYAKSLVSTLGFASNFWFYLQDNYHAAESAAKPLLHTWSLGVEEQFYILFPILIWFIYKRSFKASLVFFSLVAILSFVFAIYLSSNSQEASFYLLPSRIWELLSGSIVAHLLFNRQPSVKPILSTVFSLIGFLMLIVSIAFVDSAYQHPSYITLLPVVGTVLLIVFAGKAKYPNSLLSNIVVSYVGRLSYSIYLWHFPVFAFVYIRQLGEPLTLYNSIMLVGLTLSLSVISYHLIEKPFRQFKRFKSSTVLIIISALVALLLVYSSLIILNDGYKDRLAELESVFNGADRKDSFLLKDGKRCYFSVSNKNSCRFDNFPNGKTIINMGDSHANAISVQLYDYAQKSEMNFYNMILSHCPYIIDTWRHTGFNAKCEASQMTAVREYLMSIEPSIIVYTTRFPYYLNSDSFDNKEGGIERSLFFPFYPSVEAAKRGETVPDLIVKTLNEMGELGHLVVLVYPIPEVGWHVPNMVKNRLDKIPQLPIGKKRAAFERMSITTSLEVYYQRTQFTRSILDRVDHTNIEKVYPDKVFCSEKLGRCNTHNKSSLYYYDDDHLSQAGARMLIAEIDRVLDQKLSE